MQSAVLQFDTLQLSCHLCEKGVVARCWGLNHGGRRPIVHTVIEQLTVFPISLLGYLRSLGSVLRLRGRSLGFCLRLRGSEVDPWVWF